MLKKETENIIAKETKKKDVVEFEKPEHVSKDEYKKKLKIWFALLGAGFVSVAIGLVIAYVVFFPWNNKNAAGEEVKFSWQKEEVYAFVAVMIMLVAAILYASAYFIYTLRHKYNDEDQRKRVVAGAGFTAGFTDTFGVGSFGVSIGILKATKCIKNDAKIPGTLNVAFGVSALVESALFLGTIKVDMATLLILVASLILGAVVGSLFVSKIKDAKIVKLVMGIVLFIVAIMMILSHPNVDIIKTSDISDIKNGLIDKNNVWRIIVGVIIFLFLGVVQSFGIGLYAPSMAILSFLGMNQEFVFPIMAVGSALCMLPASYSFIKRRNYLQLTANLVLIWSIFGVVVSFLLIFVGLQQGANMDKDTFNKVLKWMAICVIFYVSISMLVEYYFTVKKQKAAKAAV